MFFLLNDMQQFIHKLRRITSPVPLIWHLTFFVSMEKLRLNYGLHVSNILHVFLINSFLAIEFPVKNYQAVYFN